MEHAKLAGDRSSARKLQSISHLGLFRAEMEKCESKYEHEPLLLKKLTNSCSGDPEGHWASGQAASDLTRINNGNESHRKLPKQIAAGHKCLMAVTFLINPATHDKVYSLQIEGNLCIEPA